MLIKISEKVSIWQKYNPIAISTMNMESVTSSDSDLLDALFLGINPTRINIKSVWYDVIPAHKLYYEKSNVDEKYHLIYIQINMGTFEYYIGKVNRPSWREVQRYKGSGIRFKSKYAKHSDEFVRYYIGVCTTAKESEELESKIVNEELLSDPKCLNLVCGGGGVSEHITSEEKKNKQRKYMTEHPEQYQSMIKAAKELYASGESKELSQRNEKIRNTMNSDIYREQSRERIKKWRENNPEEYARSRENNRIAAQSEESREKRKQSRQKWIAENPEKYAEQMEMLRKARNSDAAKAKKKKSIKEWQENNPEQARLNAIKRSEASKAKSQKAVNMLDLETKEVLKTFDSIMDAAKWLVENELAKNTNCKSSISAVCLKKECTTGYRHRQKAYGFGWEFKSTNTKTE